MDDALARLLIRSLLLVGPVAFFPIRCADAQTANHRDIIFPGLRYMRATPGEKMVVEANMHSAATAHLVTTLVEIVVDDAGRGPASTLAPLATGPIIVDSASFRFHFGETMGKSARDSAYGVAVFDSVRAALLDAGYQFGKGDDLVRSRTEADSSITMWLEGDALLIYLVASNWSWDHAVATVSSVYTYDGRICPRTLELTFTLDASGWKLVDKKKIGEC